MQPATVQPAIHSEARVYHQHLSPELCQCTEPILAAMLPHVPEVWQKGAYGMELNGPATKARHADMAGGLGIELTLAETAVVSVEIHSSRPVGTARALCGCTLDEALRLLSTLFPVCGTAQTLAGLAAAETATGRIAAPAVHHARRSLVVSEMLTSQVWRFAVDWHALADLPVDLTVVKSVRDTLAGLAHDLFGEVDWRHPGGGETAGRIGQAIDRVNRAGRSLRRQILGPATASLDSVDAVELWAAQGETAAALLVREALAPPMRTVGTHGLPMLSKTDPQWFGAHLEGDPLFGVAPSVDGLPAETGPFATLHHPVLQEARHRWGDGLPARLLAAVLDALLLPGRLNGLLSEIPARPGVPSAALKSQGSGCGVADTIRGPVAHWLRLEDDRIIDYRTVAPTEWNFHPNGVFVHGLKRRTVADAHRAGQLLVAALNPCVPTTIRVRSGPIT